MIPLTSPDECIGFSYIQRREWRDHLLECLCPIGLYLSGQAARRKVLHLEHDNN
jgi:hypothetical protein